MTKKKIDKKKIIEDSKKVFSEIMGVNIKTINDKSNPENIENWDSLGHVQLVAGLEKKFKIKISAEEGIESFTNFKQIVSFITKKYNK